MKVYKTSEIRNITLIGSSGAGKTTLAEAMMYEGGVINRRGSVNSKNTVSDYNLVEHEYGNSVLSSILYTEYKGLKLNIIDTPGMDDFVGGVIPALRVAATGLMVINGVNGIEVGTEIASRNAESFKTPLIFVVNHLDHDNTSWEGSVESAKTTFGNKIAIVQYPVNPGTGFNQVIDVLKMKMYEWGPEGGEPTITDIPEEEIEKATELHNELVEQAAENDEALMELYFDKGTLSEDEMRQGLKEGMLARSLFPVFCVCAEKDMGIRRMMEFVCNIAPNPGELPAKVTVDNREVPVTEDGPPALFVFKSAVEPHVGEINYFKVLSGKITEGMDLINSTTENKERISTIFACAGKNREKVTEMVAGDIGATVKLKETKTNHTLSEKDAGFKFKDLRLPNPRFRTAIEPVNETDDEKMGDILHKMAQEDPTYIVEYSKELKQVIIHGQGEYHLNTLKWYFENVYKLNIEFKAPRIPYRETITKLSAANYRHKKQSGGAGQFGEVHIVIEPYEEGQEPKKVIKINGSEQKMSLRNVDEHPLPWGGKLVFCNCIVGGSIDARFLPAILKGIMEKMEEGPLTGSYARDIIVYVYDGKMHPVDSNEISFKLAGRHAFSDAFKEAQPKILEPIFDVEVLVPSDRMGDVMSDLQGRRALIMGMESEKGFEKIIAKVPLKEMNKYSTALSSLTNGRAIFSMLFANYEIVPGDIQEQLLRDYEKELEEQQ